MPVRVRPRADLSPIPARTILPARELRVSLVPNLRLAVRNLLVALDVPTHAVQREIAAMEPVALAKA